MQVIYKSEYDIVTIHKAKNLETFEIVAIKEVKTVIPQENQRKARKRLQHVENERAILKLAKESGDDTHVIELKCTEDVRDGDTSSVHFVMEYFENGNVLEFLLHHGAMDEARVRKYLSQLANAFRFFQQNRIIHRDIWPKNLLLTNDYQTIKVSDFDLSIIGSRADSFVGTEDFRAPEVSSLDKYTNAVDVYSMGVTLYLMLYANLPKIGRDGTIRFPRAFFSKKRVSKEMKRFISECVRPEDTRISYTTFLDRIEKLNDHRLGQVDVFHPK